MYFDDLFTNFENKLLAYFLEKEIVPVIDCAYLVDSSYYQSISNTTHYKISSFFVLTNPLKALKDLLNLDQVVFDKLKNTLELLDDFFQNTAHKKGKEKLNHNSFIVAQHATEDQNNRSISIFFNRSNLLLKITEQHGIFFKDLGGCIDKEYISINEDDVSSSFLELVNCFQSNVLKISGFMAESFNTASIQKIKELPIEDIINRRLKKNSLYKNFTFLSRDFLMDEFKPLLFKKRSNTVSTCRDGILFGKHDIHFFLHAMKMMLESKTYINLERAVNFYHTYHMLMNIDYSIKMRIYIKDKIENSTDIMKVTFGHDFIFDVALFNGIADKQFNTEMDRTTLFEIYKLKPSSPKKIGLIQTEDFSEFYGYVFKKYSRKLSRIIEKPVADMTLDDAKVLMMYNI